MKKYFYTLTVISSLILFAFLIFAQDLSNITFPVAELGNCSNKEECQIYCDDISHLEECIIFAEKYGLTPEELKEAKMVLAAIKKGIEPPPCNSRAECDIYCSEPEHMEVCVAFAEEAGVLSPEELEEAKKVLSGIKKGAKHPNCRGKKECDAYCCGPEHMEECVAFAEVAGLISPGEAIMIRKTGGQAPGGCCGKKECDAYCDNPANMRECINFAERYGLAPRREIERAKKMLEAGLTGGPGECKGKEECEAYCNDLAHMEECTDFAVKAGFMSEEEMAQMREMVELGITTGPGGCQGKDECEAYCSNPDNMKECMEFGEKMGLVSPEEAERTQEMMMQGGPGGCRTKEECEAYCKDPAHGEECFKFGVEQGLISPEEVQQMKEKMQMMPPSSEDTMPLQKMKPPLEEMKKPPDETMAPPGESSPPQSEKSVPKVELEPPLPVEGEPQSFFDIIVRELLANVSIFLGIK